MGKTKLSPRQKMINLMYLVFIAMLAMNLSREVLSAFGFMNEEITENNATAIRKNNDTYEGLSTRAADQPAEYEAIQIQAEQIKLLSSSFYDYLDDLKAKMTANVEDKKEYESMYTSNFLDNYFFKGDKFTKTGNAFLIEVSNFRNDVNNVLGNKYVELKATVNRRFNTDAKKNKDGKKIPWLKYRYEGFPLIASITNLTQMQSKIKNTESDILSALLGGKLESEVSLNNYEGIVKLDKTAYFAGEEVKGKIVLGRYDAEMKPDKVTLNGRDYKNIKNGQVILDFPAGNIGNNEIKGVITFTENGKPINVEFNSTYSVIPQPNEAVISADKMNVVYRGLDNPISVSLPGVSDNNLRVSASSGKLTGNKGKYSLRPGTSNEVTINVNARLSSGEVNSPRKFRVKDIPTAMASVRGSFGIVRMPKSSVSRVQIGAGLPDFVFDLKLNVNSFKFKVPRQLTITVKGKTLNALAKRSLTKARRGDVITIFDIDANIVGNSSYTLKKVLPVNIEITN